MSVASRLYNTKKNAKKKLSRFLENRNSRRKIRRVQKAGYKRSLALKRTAADAREEYPVDIVVTWVDGNNPEWLGMKEEYLQKSDRVLKDANSAARYRNWGLFNYWFRSVERYAPWVRKVFLVTNTAPPGWLDLNNDKLSLVWHSDYIPKECLPTFNSRVIENNLWRISDLSEHFIYFNDDVFLTAPVDIKDFFCGGYPKYRVLARPMVAGRRTSSYEHALFNDLGLINSSFNIRKVIESAPEKWFSYVYGSSVEYIVRLYTDNYFLGLKNHHVCIPYRKSSMKECYEFFEDAFKTTDLNRFRTYADINHPVFQLWELVHNSFEPAEKSLGASYNVSRDNVYEIVGIIKNEELPSVCINDNESISDEDYSYLRETIAKALDQKLRNSCMYEKK